MVQTVGSKQYELPIGVVSLLHTAVELRVVVMRGLFFHIRQPVEPGIRGQQEPLDAGQSTFLRLLNKRRANPHGLDASRGISSEQSSSDSRSCGDQGDGQNSFLPFRAASRMGIIVA